MIDPVGDRIEIVSFADPYFDQNCMIVRRRDTKNALVMDPGLQVAQVSNHIDTHDLKIDHILITHGHLDHVFGVPAIKAQTGGRTYMHPLDKEQLERNPAVVRQFGLDPSLLAQTVVDEDLVEGQAVGWEDLAFDVIHTPGHTRGSVVFLLGERLFGGDTLFRRSIGRSDLPGGDFETLMASIHGKLYQLAPETIVYPGHGPVTTIGEEMRENPFVAIRGL